MRYLSYMITHQLPVYGEECVEVPLNSKKAILRGDSCNVFSFTIENHWGTHVDCPAHFFDHGKRVSDYPPETWVFDRPCVLNLNLQENQLIRPTDLQQLPSDIDLLLIKSNFGRFRGRPVYSKNNPGFTPETGKWLRKNVPSLRAVGFDFISLSSYNFRSIGREAHQAFLDPDALNSPIFIIEDMDLSGDLTGLTKVMIAPLRLEGVDSAPCTIIGIFS